ncbi:MAG TPA: 30S ribosomal protein S8 [Candidatus Saccharimonadales bacterium]|nr:30S ribosomal protein S8 [Candidatus Saccharimonadales bacterium]
MITTTDPIADMLARIRNAIGARKNEVSMPHSNIKEAVAKLLQENGFISGVNAEDSGVEKRLNLVIYGTDENPRITEITRMSKPGRRHYVNSKEIPTVKRGRGIVIVSTSKGVMTGDDAREAHIGGELICKVY